MLRNRYMNITMLTGILAVVMASLSCSAQNLRPLAESSGGSGSATIELGGKWKFQTDPGDIGVQKSWMSPELSDSSWREINVPGEWENQGITQENPVWKQADDLNQPYTGYAWYRRTVTIPADWKGRPVTLRLGAIDDLDWTYVNGVKVGSTTDRMGVSSAVDRVYTVPESAVRWGQPNVIAVRVLDLRGLGGIRGGATPSIWSGGVTTTSTPDGDAVNVMGHVSVEKGQTVNDAVAVMGNVDVYGHVRGDVVAVMGTVRVHDGGRVDGDAVAVMGRVIKDDGATIGGQVTSVGPGLAWGGLGRAGSIRDAFDGSGRALSILSQFLINLLFVLVAVLIAALFPARTETIARAGLDKTGESALYGIIGLLLLVPIAILLIVTCIGIPLVFVEGLLFLVAWMLGFVGISLAIGWRLGEAANKPVMSPLAAVAIGGLVGAFIELIPFVGGWVTFVLEMIGFGAVIFTGFGASPDWIRNRRKTETPSEPT